MQAATNIDSKSSFTPTTDNPSTLYIHWTYHPHGIQRHELCHIYNDTLNVHIPFDRMQVAIAWAKKLRNILTKATLDLPPGLNAQQLILHCSPINSQEKKLRLHPFPYTTAATTQYAKWDYSRHTLLPTNPFALSPGYLYPYAIHSTCAEFFPKPRIELKSTSLQPNLSNSMATSAMEHPHAVPQASPFNNQNLQKNNTTKENPFGGQRL